MRFRSSNLGDAKDYIVTALLLIMAFAIMVGRHQGGIDSLRTVSVTALSLLEEPLANIRIYRQALNTNTYLHRQNILLQDELSRLRAIEQENRELRRLLDFREESDFDMEPVLIVGKEISGINNTLTIDAGTNDAIKENMPLVTSDGLVGKVVLTGSNYSQVMPYYNSLFRVSARIQENQANGIVSWSGDQYGELVMDFVPKTVPVDSGFTVETSGYSNQFPGGIPIGRVTRTEPEPGRETQRIFLEPFVSLSDIAQGFVVKFQPDSSVIKLQQQYNQFFE
ncbi:rod shape-determining protein MreC [Gracilimonas mengyeensis]|uniref:Cell shape-determining protein MreC n=1 Tax=Gracilimonas mengyeensis TaxID=1302730 RepID=A0A521ER15_9BACT|nr:rod shape-determining protein MreC [Gracilimonas mengyeensis]SMO86366.1 rod shape-determining protein MreC [Gracilimonas mengyeensis]